MSTARLLVAAPASGGGKTMLTAGLLGVLRARGLRPAAAKCGPDYIDPMYHQIVLGVPSCTLDLFLANLDTVRGLLARQSADADCTIIEGVMGYYDGVDSTDRASAYDVARTTRTPVLLVLDPKGASLSLAALVRGFMEFREDACIGGLFLNRCTPRLCSKLAPVLERETGLRVFGCLPPLAEAELPGRSLGLVPPAELPDIRDKMDAIAASLEATADVDGLLALARTAEPLDGSLPCFPMAAAPVTIAVARDAAFCFQYAENITLLRSLGARIEWFSPLADTCVPSSACALWLGGGWPELHARELSANASMRRSIRAAVEAGMPTVAECGGFMYLQQTLHDKENTPWPMCGALPGVCTRQSRLQRFGYATLTAEENSLLCRAGEEVPVHEFHYWDSTHCGQGFVARKAQSEWRCVVAGPAMYAGFPHLYLWSNPAMAQRFVAAAAAYGSKQ